MSRRRALVALVLTALTLAAAVGLARSAGDHTGPDPVRAVAAGLRCPACQGESVADSNSPIAAAMRQAVADQVAAGRDRAEIRRWFVARYGPDVLTDPPVRTAELLLWGVPLLVLLGGGYAAVRTLRPRARRAAAGPAPPPDPRAARRAWRALSLGLVALVATVAVAADRLARPAAPAAAPADPVAVAVQLAGDLEAQHRYDAAAQLYREALRDRPDDMLRLRLGFALLRAGDSAGAAGTAREVLAHAPDSPDGLLVLGLAERTDRPAEADRTLRRFLAVAPRHPAAAEISRLIGGVSGGAGTGPPGSRSPDPPPR
ncbi:cytochrome c-type biogenesis protein CcmH [Micromonospora soli]|uniref:cytochrome c-type biogenesis protein CcmH n=1 Tax=Micromonospora sp. NBRC 110009 TaxID=3061627 RepID=UPI00267417A3|nr:cytochrome c-type biogenesis protein CcmH [Micromonospora sp. NBRC 110009]WKT97354.1 cytochrome c-type biogenesis protein CcmH [Micromonospora sp. NBRC 110009]